jgi:Leucine-rich repeat (LRR) protein
MDAVSDVNDAELKRFPVENVSWDRCQIFVEKLNAFEKEKGWVYRLPTEAEWEYACRGGPMSDKADSSFDFYFAKPTNTILPEQANFWHENCLKRTCKVGAYEPNVLGLYDMHGNVAQLCIDLYDPQAPEVSLRSSRGGGWHNVGFYCRAANRRMHPSSGRDNALGLRLARVPPGAPSPEAKTQLEIAPLRDVDTRRIAALAAAVQVEEVRKELMRRNPGFDGKFEHKIEDGVVTEFRIVTDHVTDISPIRVWSSLRVLDCGAPKANGQLADLSPLKGMDLTGLKQIVLYGTQVTDASLACFKDCRSVTELWLNHTQVGDAGLAYFKYCNTLTSLWLEGTRVTGAGLFYFKNCKSLTDLRLSGSQVGDAGLCHLKDCKSLKWLFLYDTKVTDAGLAYFQDCKSLTYIWLSSTRVTDAGLEYFKDCTDLTHLDFTDTQVSDAGLAYFKDCKSLTFLGLGDTQIADAGLANFKGICLKNLRINNTGVTDLSPLQGMPLEEIYLTPKNIVKGLEILRDMKSLKTIGIRGGAVWPAAEFWERFDKGEFKE